MVKKKVQKSSEKPKKLRFWVVLVVIAVLAMIVVGVIYRVNHPIFHYEGWIDCMPPLEGAQAELCAQAEAADYPFIAY